MGMAMERHATWECGRKRSLASVLAGLLLLLAVLASCALPGTGAAATPTPDRDLATLKGFPAYSLQYPGTALLESHEGSRTPTLLGTNGAKVSRLYGLHAPVSSAITPQVILDWYDQRLREQG